MILDEPTAVLGPADVDQLLATMGELPAAGKTIVFITHKLGEVMRVADDVTVLKGGEVVWSGPSRTRMAPLARAMVGSTVETVDVGEPRREPGT